MHRACIFILASIFAMVPVTALAATQQEEQARAVYAEQQSVKNLLQIVALSGYLAGAESHCNLRRSLTIKACMSLVASRWSDISGLRLTHPEDATDLAKTAWEKSLDDGQRTITSQKACPDIEENANKLEILSLCKSVRQQAGEQQQTTAPTSQLPHQEEDTSDQGNHVINEEMSIQ